MICQIVQEPNPIRSTPWETKRSSLKIQQKNGWRQEVLYNPFIIIQTYLIFNQFVSWSCELNEKKIVWMKVKVFIWILSNFQWLVSCGLAGLPQVPVFSRVGGGEMTQMKVKVLSLYLDLLVSFCFECQCLIRSWGRKYSYDDSINQYIQAFSCSKRTTNKHHTEKVLFSESISGSNFHILTKMHGNKSFCSFSWQF